MTSIWRVQHDQIVAWYEARNRRDWAGVEGLVVEQFILRDYALGGTFYGRQEFLKYLRGTAEAFPDGHIKLEHMAGSGHEGQVIVVEYTMVGTQSGLWGTFPPSHKKAVFQGCDLLRFDHEHLASCTTYGDYYRLLCELGHVVSSSRRGSGQAA